MEETRARHWHPTAAYLYVLHLDGPALAWEYLRRHPDYRLDWRHRRRPDAARRWGLRLLEDPALDARDAHPDWCPDPAASVQLHPDLDMPDGGLRFDLWALPGHKQLSHDGRRLRLAVDLPGRQVRLALAPGLADGMACAYGARAAASSEAEAARARHRALALGVALLDGRSPPAFIQAGERPAPMALQELHSLQALDGTLAGASLREVAEVLFGTDAISAGWHADGGLRARTRRLVQRGDALMRGGYRHLLQNESLEQGRFAKSQNGPEQAAGLF
ncbi:TPA: DUF2285 domain-containing protein [Citrobacter freundii]|uniref:DUF2285 domain-containing protein n=1 Tax=Gammaproteobacteria TaxID=1236 RepID=UPI00079873B5|nr:MULTISPECIES: DUF2285 domain-containing protein [Gammaproteobacteria]MBN5418813.1 DUF2285 domain-containing protein [Serratia marcescens]HBV8384434.1 DUF2285 domain-containing protein [Citrobacter freundii]RQI36245.1 DUF2285 domain-containing protein [Pseudomonas aeruginosa]SAF37543.1 Uncharacterized conserved protein [Enterobacter hormaechei]HDY6068330.1 DUF2285 domain-containing protein [Pseudomonas aeruginosa]